MTARIDPILTPAGTRYAVVVAGRYIQAFDYMSVAIIYAFVEGYEVEEDNHV